MAKPQNPYRDSSDHTLEDYPRPSVAVDTAVLTIADGQLCVLLTLTNDAVRGGVEEWRLPGTFLHQGETLADAVLRSLWDKAGVEGLAPRQLHVFDDPGRDDRGWVLSVAHLDVVRLERLAASDRTRTVAVDELSTLPYGHSMIVAFAVDALRADYQRMPDPAQLLDRPFTMRELRHVHEAVAGSRLLPDTFRRSMLPRLVATGDLSRSGRGRPAELYRTLDGRYSEEDPTEGKTPEEVATWQRSRAATYLAESAVIDDRAAGEAALSPADRFDAVWEWSSRQGDDEVYPPSRAHGVPDVPSGERSRRARRARRARWLATHSTEGRDDE